MKKLTVTLTRTELTLGILYLIAQMIVLPFAVVLANNLLGAPLDEAQVNFVFFCVNFLGTTLLFHRFLIASGTLAIKDPFRCVRFAGLGLFLYWVTSTVAGMIIMQVYPSYFNVNDSSIQALTAQNETLMAIGTVLLVPVVEETLYRGVVFGGLYGRCPWAAYVVSVILFSALHVVSYIGLYEPVHLMICFLQYVPAGLCLCWAYVKADNIWAPILMHITINQIGIFSMR